MTRYGRPYWWDQGAVLPQLPDTPPGRAEVLVIGAGFTGLSAAITARRAGADVTICEAGVPGIGASTRNGGMIGPHSRMSFANLTRSFGAEIATAILSEAPEGYAFTQSLIRDEGIDCDFQVTGRVQMALTERQFAGLREIAATLEALTGYKGQVLGPADIAAHIGTGIYRGGLFYPDHGGLHPRKFHDGLLALALSLGVTIVQNCPVTGIARSGAGFAVTTTGGRIRAGRVIMATNGYTRAPFSWFRARVFPLPSFIIATEELPKETLDRLAPGRRMMVETRARHSYYRVSPDDTRILFGGRAGMVPVSPEFAIRRLKATMVGIWPELENAKITHSWSGYTGFAFEQMPSVGEHDGIHYAMGYSGSGVALSPYLGMKAAYRALGDKRGATTYAEAPMTTRAYHPFGWPWFLAAGEVWYRQVVDRLEDAEAARDARRLG